MVSAFSFVSHLPVLDRQFREAAQCVQGKERGFPERPGGGHGGAPPAPVGGSTRPRAAGTRSTRGHRAACWEGAAQRCRPVVVRLMSFVQNRNNLAHAAGWELTKALPCGCRGYWLGSSGCLCRGVP